METPTEELTHKASGIMGITPVFLMETTRREQLRGEDSIDSISALTLLLREGSLVT